MARQPGLYPLPKVEPSTQYASAEAKALIERSEREWEARRAAAPKTTQKVAL